VRRVGVARAAELLYFHPVGMHLFILGRVVVALLAIQARQNDFRPHCVTPFLKKFAKKKDFRPIGDDTST